MHSSFFFLSFFFLPAKGLGGAEVVFVLFELVVLVVEGAAHGFGNACVFRVFSKKDNEFV